MAFHVACPITCRKICYCTLGFPRALRSENGKEAYIDEVVRVEQLLKDPWRLRAKDGETVQVKVPKVVVVVAPPPPPPPRPVYVPVPAPVFVPQLQQQQQTQLITVGDGGGDVDEVALANASAQTKRFALQKKAAAASVVAEDFARRFEAGDLEVTAKDIAGEDQGLSNVKIMCRLCFSGEDEASERARKMLPCKSCGKKYHRNCVKAWSQNRDLFHWSSWTCPSCRICEVCRRTGDPNKFMFCRRCDAAYHCYCQHPPHKNVSSGPYLCPKHTKCHSCGSNVPGNGLSLRWFLGYTCCDACGRLFMKGNYCPICLKVYRDSESTPMVCCDICQRWVHCQCDDISDEKYHQFQVDGNLQYVCATCRGECCQVRNIEEAVQELWRRKDEADVDLILSLRAAAGLPTQEDIFSITPFSDDEDNDPVTVNNEYGRSLKLSLKGPVVDKSPKKTNNKSSSSNKKSGKKKPSTHNNFDAISSPDGGIRSSKRVQIKTNKWMDGGDSSAVTAKGPSKLVIHIGARNKNSTDASRDPILTSSNGGKDKDLSQMVDQHVTPVIPSADTKGGGDKVEGSKMKGKEGHLIKFKKHNAEASKLGGTFGSISPPTTTTTSSVKPEVEAPPPPRRGNRVSSSSVKYRSGSDDETQTPVKESRPLLKLKFKKPYQESQSQSSWLTNKEEEKSLAKGQRSKRKRHVSSSSTTLMEDNNTNSYQDNAMDEMMDASWILQKLGKDAIGKRVEMHQPSDNTWHRGTVAQVFEGTSMISVGLDDGNSRNLELGKQGIRFVSQKQKRV